MSRELFSRAGINAAIHSFVNQLRLHSTQSRVVPQKQQHNYIEEGYLVYIKTSQTPQQDVQMRTTDSQHSQLPSLGPLLWEGFFGRIKSGLELSNCPQMDELLKDVLHRS